MPCDQCTLDAFNAWLDARIAGWQAQLETKQAEVGCLQDKITELQVVKDQFNGNSIQNPS